MHKDTVHVAPAELEEAMGKVMHRVLTNGDIGLKSQEGRTSFTLGSVSE